MLKIVLCDDNRRTLDRLENLLESIFIKHTISGNIVLKATSAIEVLDFISQNSANLFILNIDLKNDVGGLELASKIRDKNKNSYIIFSTGHFEYVLTAYKFKTFDYLPKPVVSEKLEETILRLLDDMQTDNKQYLQLNKNILIDESTINYIRKDGMKLVFYTKDNKYETYSSFSKIEEQLTQNFVRCHKSFIVNVNNILNVETNRNLISFVGNDTCHIGPKYKNKFMEVFNYGNFSNNLGSVNNA